MAPRNVKDSLADEKVLIQMLRQGLGVTRHRACRLKDRILHCAEHGIEVDGIQQTLTPYLQLHHLRTELGKDRGDPRFRPAVREDLLGAIRNQPHLTLQQLNIFPELHMPPRRLQDMDFREVAEEATTRATLPECLEAVERARIDAEEFESWNEQFLTRALQVDVENAGHRGRIVACLLRMKAEAV